MPHLSRPVWRHVVKRERYDVDRQKTELRFAKIVRKMMRICKAEAEPQSQKSKGRRKRH